VKYPIQITRDAESIPPYTVTFPDFPGLKTGGDTTKDADKAARQEVLDAIKRLRNESQPIPDSSWKEGQHWVDLSPEETIEGIRKYNEGLNGMYLRPV
jgi:predicted RNase H-like HicB family nuclease